MAETPTEYAAKFTALSSAYEAITPPALPAASNGVLASGVGVGSTGAGSGAMYGFWYRPKGGGAPEVFMLPLAPQEITIDEPASTTIIPTLGAGKYVERRGSIFKTITLSGTFGHWAGSAKFAQISYKDANGKKTPVVKEEDEAFYKFHKLREFFRNYQSQFTANGANHESSYMVWTNTKDAENFIVEPTSFRMRRQRAFMYHYQIDLRVLGVYKGTQPYKAKEERLTSDQLAAAIQAAISKAVEDSQKRDEAEVPPAQEPDTRTFTPLPKNVDPTLKKWSDQADLVSQRITAGTGNVAALALTPVNELLQLVTSYERIFSSVYGAAYSVGSSVLGVMQAGLVISRQAINLLLLEEGRADYQLLKGQAMLLGTAGQELAAAWNLDINAFSEGTKSPSYNNQTATAQASLTTTGGKIVSVGTSTPADPSSSSYGQTRATVSQTYLPADQITGTRQETVLPNETGEAFAARVAGSPLAWPLIVLLNQLKPPYFSNGLERLPGTLRPGDVAVIPVFGGAQDQNNVTLTDSIPAVDFFTEVKSYNAGTKTITVPNNPGWRDNRWKGYKLTREADNTEYSITTSGSETLTLTKELASVIVGEQLRIRSVTPVDAGVFDAATSVLARAMGRDLRLRNALPPAYSSEIEVCDLTLTDTGDISLVEGSNNFLQSIAIKLRSRYGDLPLHTSNDDSFGLSLSVGSTGTAETLFRLSTNIRNTLLGDPRVASVKNVSTVLDRDVLQVALDVQPIGSKLFTSVSGRIV